SWPVAGTGATTTSAPARAADRSSVISAGDAERPLPSETSVMPRAARTAASGPGVRDHQRTVWPARVRSAAVVSPPLPEPRTALFISFAPGGLAPAPRRPAARPAPSRHRPGGSEGGHALGWIAEQPAQDLVGVLAEPRGRRDLEAEVAVGLDRSA